MVVHSIPDLNLPAFLTYRQTLKVEYSVDYPLLSSVFCPTCYYTCCPKEIGSVAVKVKWEIISMDPLKLVELSQVSIT